MLWKIATLALLVALGAISYGSMWGIDGFNKTHLDYVGSEGEQFPVTRRATAAT